MAAVKGFFDILKVVVAELYKTRRQEAKLAHEVRMLRLKTLWGDEELDLDEPEDKTQEKLQHVELVCIAKVPPTGR